MQLVKRINLVVDNDNDEHGLTAHILHIFDMISERYHIDEAVMPIYIIHV